MSRTTRTISISIDVYAAIWAARQSGEETEDAILYRKFGCKQARIQKEDKTTDRGIEVNGAIPQNQSITTSSRYGIRDSRNNVDFPEGFEVFRKYKGQRYWAIVSGGMWERSDTKKSFTSLNQVNASIAEGAENVWSGSWRYLKDDGSTASINELRRR